jgi:hypothetical protein
MPKLKFDNALKTTKPKFDYAKAGIKEFTNFKDFRKFFSSAMKMLEKEGFVREDEEENNMAKYITKDPSGKFIVVDNTSGDLFTEEFETEEEAQNYLMADSGIGEDFKK